MEKIDLNKIMISKDLPIFFDREKLKYLESIGIKTLHDLKNAYQEGIFYDRRKKFNKELVGEIEIILSYYFKTPLINDDILYKEVDLNNLEDIFNDNKIKNSLKRIGITENELRILKLYFKNGLADKIIYSIEDSIIGSLKIFCNDIHYISKILASSGDMYHLYAIYIQNLLFKIKFFESYLNNKNNQNQSSDINIIRKLNFELEFLKQAKVNLDNQINLLNNQIKNINNVGELRR